MRRSAMTQTTPVAELLFGKADSDTHQHGRDT